ncbi:MAG: hypothetical protein AB7U20_10360 [Planctomycetaceae bacterium]
MDLVVARFRLRRALRGRLIGLVLGLLIGAGGSAPSASADPVFTNRGRFRIPYQLDAEEIKRLGATEIQLHVSTDGGRTWKHVDSVPPVEGKFTFDAAGDGEYAFAVRTVDRRGNLHPTGPLAASLQVTVDTTPPELELNVVQEAAGRVQIRWDASDSHLDPATLKLEHRDPTSEIWQPVQVDATANGQTSWSLAEGGLVEVRGSIRDGAGNESSTQASTNIEAAQEQAAPPEVPQRRQPIAAADPAIPPAEGNPESPLPKITPEVVAFSRTVSDATAQPTSETPSQVIQPERRVEPAPKAAAPASKPAVVAVPQTPERPAPVAPEESGSSLRHVGSTSFQIAYALDDVGPSGVGSVDLYLTENGGQQWFHYGADQDRRSPFQVTVPNDGTYGFSIRVKSGVGLAMIPPQPNDPPDMTVIVDRQPPRAALLPIRQSADASTQQVAIEWKLTDEALPEQPVALSYAEHLSGPWQPLGEWLPNTGRYVWEIGPNLPAQVYVRLDARDAAGNMTRVETETPIVIDLSRPTARFLNVETAR